MSVNKTNYQDSWERLLQGDEKAFDQLFTHFYPGLLRYAKSMLPYPSDEAEDIISDVFCYLWIHRDSLQIRESVAAYLYRAVKNRVINVYKKSKPNWVDAEEGANEIATKTHELPDQMVAYKEFNQQIYHLIDQLPDKTKQVFLLSREEGLTYEQIAEVMDVTINTIKTHMFRAIRFLKAAFNANEYLGIWTALLFSFFA